MEVLTLSSCRRLFLILVGVTTVFIFIGINEETNWYVNTFKPFFQTSLNISLLANISSNNKSYLLITDLVLKLLHVHHSQKSIQKQYERVHQFIQREELPKCLQSGRNGDMLTALSTIVQNRIFHLQHPNDCKHARKMVVSVGHSGYGSQLHRLMLYFMYAYAKNRTVVFVDKGWRYSENGKNTWGDFHEPLSSTCYNPSGKTVHKLTEEGHEGKHQVVRCWDCLKYLNKTLLKSIPVDIASVLTMYHARPLHWWAGQFLKYIFKPKRWIMQHIKNVTNNHPVVHPIVGIHVRTTDKVSTNDSDFFPLTDYLRRSDNFLCMVQSSKLNMFLATDNESVVHEAKETFPNYNIVNEEAHAKTASKFRFSKTSLVGIITDIYLLSQTDYLVCTFSSNVGKAAYELMQAQTGDKSFCAYSLDSEYWLFQLCRQTKIATEDNLLSHSSLNGELELKVGDMIDIYEKGRQAPDGYSAGSNLRLNTTGIYPLNKAIDYILVYTSLNYSHFDLRLV